MRELSLHVLDIAENSVRAGATALDIGVDVDRGGDLLSISVSDNGSGISSEKLSRLTDPFMTSRTERKVGLGLPLLAAACERTGGRLEVDSGSGRGTRVRAIFGLSSIDRAPMGDLADSVAYLAASNAQIRLRLVVTDGDASFEFDSKAVQEQLDGVPISEPVVVQWMREHLTEGISQVTDLE